jgi:5-methylcytosine-specific restriction endonuclease McrA
MEAQRPDDLQFALKAFRSGDAKRMFKQQIFERDGHQCRYCGDTEDLTLDHVRPKSRGGQHVSSNLVTACRDCNRSKASNPVRDWLISQPFFHPSTLQSLPL